MSQENVEIVRAVYEAFARGDGVTPFEFYAPDIVWDASALAVLDATVFHGHDGVRAAFRDLLATFREFEFQADELRAAGDCVLATIHERGVGRASGVVLERRHDALWTLRDGKVVRMRVYLDRSADLEAVGLRE